MKEKRQNLIKGAVIGKKEFCLLSCSKLKTKVPSKIDGRLSTAYAEARRKVSGNGKA